MKATAAANKAMEVDYNPVSDIVDNNINDQASTSRPLEAFMRSTAAGVMTLSGYTARDLIPPARVTDLTATGTSYPDRSVTLQWTAPGDDAYTGNGISAHACTRLSSMIT